MCQFYTRRYIASMHDSVLETPVEVESPLMPPSRHATSNNDRTNLVSGQFLAAT